MAENPPAVKQGDSLSENVLTLSASQLTQAKKSKIEDAYELGQVLGEGAYGAVVLGQEKATNREVAVKIIDKNHIKKEKKVQYAVTEKNILSKCNNPFIIKLYATFHDDVNLYYVLELAPGGELLTLIKKNGGFSVKTTAYYAAEIILALEYLHTKAGIMHRDLKPENILLSAENHVKITDFGTAKDVGTDPQARSNSFVGTAEYISPELLNEKTAFKASDLWALGCIIYQMIANRPPFRALNEYLTFQKVTSGTISYPNNFPEIAKDLISKLVVKDVFSRLGANDFADLKAHPFFKDIDWFGLGKGQAPPIEKYPEPLVWQEDIIREEEERKRRKKEEERKEWEQFLLENEQILESGLIYKRRKLSIKKRFMILTDTPRIIYIDPKKKILKGEVPWSKKLFVEPKRIYYLEDVKKNAYRWSELIRKLQKEGNTSTLKSCTAPWSWSRKALLNAPQITRTLIVKDEAENERA